MAYLGLGLQKWIYSRKPRKKLFVREGLSSFTALPKYSRTFKLQPSVTENKTQKGFLTLIVTLLFIVLLSFSYTNFNTYSNKKTALIHELTELRTREAFNFLFHSGKYRLLDNNIKGAYSEFELAYHIDPGNQELNQLIIETLSILCLNDNNYCKKLDYFLQKPL
tara:strand:+ start:21687 stop:22181 length:495 start_codon:yes stop_codon:yes gene_type:complete